MRISHVLSTAVAVLLVGSTASAYTAGKSYVNPKLASGQVSIRKVCVMPADASMTRLGMKGGEGMARESDNWTGELQTIVEKHLKQSGIELIPGGMTPAELQGNEQLQQVVVQIQQKYDSVSTQLEKKSKDVKKSRFTLGDEVAMLPCAATSDALAFVHADATVLTGGKKAFGMLVAGPASSSASLRVVFVDARTGEVLAYSRLLNNGKFVKDSEKAFGEQLDKQFQKMGIGTGSGGK